MIETWRTISKYMAIVSVLLAIAGLIALDFTRRAAASDQEAYVLSDYVTDGWEEVSSYMLGGGGDQSSASQSAVASEDQLATTARVGQGETTASDTERVFASEPEANTSKWTCEMVGTVKRCKIVTDN